MEDFGLLLLVKLVITTSKIKIGVTYNTTHKEQV